MIKINTHSGQLIKSFAKLNEAATNNCKNSTNNNYQLSHHMKKYQIAKSISCFYCIKGKGLIISQNQWKILYINYYQKLLTPKWCIQEENSAPVFKLNMKINLITSTTWCIMQSALVRYRTKSMYVKVVDVLLNKLKTIMEETINHPY